MLRVLAGSVVLFLLLGCLAPLAFGDEDVFQEVDREEFLPLLESIMEANKQALSRIERGAGKAYISETKKGISAALQDIDFEERLYMEFRFDGDSQQHERYAWSKDDGIGELVSKGFNSSDLWANYHDLKRNHVLFREGNKNGAERLIGRNFRPDAFRLTGVASRFRGLHNVASDKDGLAQGWTFRIAKLENGLTSLEWRMEPPENGWERFGRITVDPARNYLFVSFDESGEAFSKTGHSFYRWRYEMEWGEYDGVMYPSRVFWKRRHKDPERAGEKTVDMTDTLEMRIEQFDPNPSIPDNAFTLEGLNLPPGTTIVDVRPHVNSTYVYGALPEIDEELEDVLDEPDLDDDPEPVAQMEPSSDDTVDSAAAPEKDTSPVDTASAKWPVIILIVAACLIIVLLLKRRKK